MANLEGLAGTRFLGRFSEEGKDESFELFVFHYNHETGLFLARAEDTYGESGITGLIRNGEIKFQKTYPKGIKALLKANRVPPYEAIPMYDDWENVRILNYEGTIVQADNRITGEGIWYARGFINHQSWRMDSV